MNSKSISVQRDKIYAERNHILEASDFDDFNFEQLEMCLQRR